MDFQKISILDIRTNYNHVISDLLSSCIHFTTNYYLCKVDLPYIN